MRNYLIMEIANKNTVAQIVSKSLEKSQMYDEFIELMNELVANGSTTGDYESEALVNYTMLNQRRFIRWDKTLKVSDDITQNIAKYDKNITWLVLTESWCGDAAHMLPVLNKMASANENINLKIVLRDENPELMDEFLTDGNKSIPKLIMFDDMTKEVLNSYGSRPKELTQIAADYKLKHGKLTPEFKEDIQKWYNKNKGQAIITDMLELLK